MGHRAALLTGLVAVLAVLAFAPATARADDPFLGWHTLETEHFVIHYHDGLGELPQRVARYCEEAHLLLVPLMDWLPADKTQVIINDLVDTANGSASIVPRNTMNLFMTGPEARSSLGDYDDWLLALIIHEYTHILHIDTIYGVPAFLNDLLGKTTSPNQLLPRWYTEGLATYEESARTGGGRVRSSLFHTYLRTAYLDDNFYDLGQLSAFQTYTWPRGATPYLYGSHFLAYVAETRGEDFFRRFNHIYGGRFIPYSMNTTAREVIGEDFVELYAEWRAHAAGMYEAQLLKVRMMGVTEMERLTDHGQSADSPRPRHGHRQVTWYAASGLEQAGLYTHDLDTGEVERLFEIHGGAGAHAWDPTGRYAIYHATRRHKNIFSFNELLIRDTQTDEELQLTDGRRGRDPAFDPTGQQVVYVENGGGNTALVLFDLRTKTRRTLVDHTGLGQLDTPTFSPDGRFVAVSLWREAIGRDIYVFDFKSNVLFQVTQDRALDLEPTFSPDGKWLVFSSDRTAIYNIYALDVDALTRAVDAEAVRDPDKTVSLEGLPVHQVTRVERGVFTPHVVDDGDKHWLYVSSFERNGFDISRMAFQPDEGFLGTAPVSQLARPEIVMPTVSEPLVTRPSETYRPWRWLLPQAIFPLLAFTNGGRDSLGVELLAFDPIGHHSWTLLAEYFDETESAFVALNYSYGRLPIPLNMGFQWSSYERTQSLVAESRFVPFTEQAFDAQLSTSVPILDAVGSHRISMGYNFRLTDFFERPEIEHDPADVQPTEPTRQGNFSSVFVSYLVGATDRFGRSVSTEEGFTLNLTLRYQDTLTGSDFRSVRATYVASYFLANPWLDNHALSFRTRGGMSRSDFRRREQFSIGGPPEQEVLTAVINEAPIGGTFMRGFEPGTAFGEQFHVWSVEYRYPIWDLATGFDTLPFHIGRLSGSVFNDNGTAFNGPLADARLFHGVGAELLLETTLGYALPLFFRLGYGHGFGKGGIDDVYFYLGGSY